MDPLRVITSLQNPQVKRLVKLRHRREREREKVILVEGARELKRALDAGLSPIAAFVCPELHTFEAKSVAVRLVTYLQLSSTVFHKISYRENPDGIIAVFPTPALQLSMLNPDGMIIVLHGLEKPGNIGAIIRTADAAGVLGILVLGHGADVYSPNVIRASQGSVFSLPVITTGEQQVLDWLSEQGFSFIACTPDASCDYWDAPLTGRVALFLGSEHKGLPAPWRKAGLPVRVPMHGAADSLNVAVATALIVYEAVRQTREKTKFSRT